MTIIKSPSQLKAEHPDWDKHQVFDAFYEPLNRKIKSVKRDLQGIKAILDNDPVLHNDGWAGWYSEFIRRAVALLNPDFGHPFDFEDESTTPEQDEVMGNIMFPKSKENAL